MKVFAFACMIFAVCISTSLQWTPIYDCLDRNTLLPVPTSLNVEGCHSFPCEFGEHSNLTAKLDFVAQTNALSLKTQVNVIMERNTVPYPWGTDQQGCKSLSRGKCPFKRGEEATFHINMRLYNFILPFTPLWYEFKLLDESNEVQACFRLYNKVVKGFPSSHL